MKFNIETLKKKKELKMERKKNNYTLLEITIRGKKIKLSYWDAVRNDVCVMIECCKDPMIWDVNAINCSKLAIITSLSFKVRQISVLVTCNHLVQMKIPSEGENLPMKWWIFKQVKTCDLEEIYNIASERCRWKRGILWLKWSVSDAYV